MKWFKKRKTEERHPIFEDDIDSLWRITRRLRRRYWFRTEEDKVKIDGIVRDIVDIMHRLRTIIH